MSFNKITIVGYLGRDAEVRYTPDGTAVADFSVATTEKTKKDSEVTTWFKVTIWGKRAESVSQYLEKGKFVYIEGSLQAREYQDKNGTTRTSLEVRANDVVFLGKNDA